MRAHPDTVHGTPDLSGSDRSQRPACRVNAAFHSLGFSTSETVPGCARPMNPIQILLVLLLRLYKLTLSPAITFLFGPTAGCRFTPTCSVYALEAIKLHGAIAGTWLAVKRICRCHPWGECGCDPVPGTEVRSAKCEARMGNC